MKFERVVEFHRYDQFVELLYILHKNNRKYLNDSLAQYNLNLLQAMCLLIMDNEKDIIQQDLTDLLYLTKGGTTKAVNKLEADGYIIKSKSEIDARQYVLNLTDKGREIIPVLEKINKNWESLIGFDELDEEFLEIIKQMAYKSIDLNSNH